MLTITRPRSCRWSVSVSIVAGLAWSLFAAGIAAAGPRAFVLTDNTLLSIDTANPAAGGPIVPITGLNAGDTLVGIDFRAQNGHLYGLGFNSATGTVTVYHISHRTGVAAAVGSPVSFTASDGTTPQPVTGTNFGVDFSPATDRIRVVTDSGQSFRLNPNNGAGVDGNAGASGTQMDGPIGGATATVNAAAHTNNQQSVTVTTLYTLSGATNQLLIQNPPNNGTQTLPLTVSLDGSVLDFSSAGEFDILPGVNVATSNSIATGTGLAALTVGGAARLYTIDLSTGAATLLGTIGSGAVPIQGFAAQGEAASGGLPAIGLTSFAGNANLTRFNTVNPSSAAGTSQSLSSVVDSIVAIDWRPQTGQLFGLGINTATDTGTLYLIDPNNGATEIVGSASGIAFVNGSGTPVDLPDPSVGYGFDFDPTVDRIRVVTNTGLNFRINPNTGAPIDGNAVAAGIQPDSSINGLPGGSTGVAAAAYTNSFGQALSGGVTTLYTVDPAANRLFIQNPPNAGTLTQGVDITLDGTPLDVSVTVALDISPAGRGYTTSGGTLFYDIDLSTGVATLLGIISVPAQIVDVAVGDGPPVATTTTLLSSANPALITDMVTITANMAPATATGTVAFTLGGTPIAGCEARPVTAGTASCAVAIGAAGTFPVAATYSGDALHGASTSTSLSQVVTLPATTTTVTAAPNPADPSQHVTLTATVSPGAATGSVTFQIDGSPVGTVALSGGQATLTTSPLTPGVHQIVASYAGSATFAASTSTPLTLTVATSGPLTQHFAEGATGFFQSDIGILNASKTDAANVTVRLFPEGGALTVLTFPLDPLARRTIDVNAVLGPVGGVSAVVESDRPVAATRQMTWGSPIYASTLESGIPETATSWYFAEGATNVFSLFYLIENPGTMQANVTLTHLLEGGAAPVVQNEVVPPQSRRTFFINAVPGLEGASLSTVITSDVAIVAERAMYLNTTGRQWEGGTTGRGATSPSTTWSFAEGATGFFHTYLLLGNANTTGATVTVRYQLADGTVITKEYAVASQSRRTVDVNGEDPQLASAAVGMSITSTLPIVAERAIWWGTPFYEGSVALGSTITGPTWAIGEAVEGGPSGSSTFVLVANGSSTTGTVRFTVVYDDGTRQQRDYALLGNARLTVRIADDFLLARNARFSVLVESLTAAVPITVETSQYQSSATFGEGGGAALATRIR
jgi:hypothetical protein